GGQLEAAGNGAVVALRAQGLLAVLLLVELPNLGAQADLVAFDGNLDVLLAYTGQLGFDAVAGVGFLHVDADLRGGGQRITMQRLDKIAGRCELLEKIIEQISADRKSVV